MNSIFFFFTVYFIFSFRLWYMNESPKAKTAIFLFPFTCTLVILIYFHLISCSICLPEEVVDCLALQLLLTRTWEN